MNGSSILSSGVVNFAGVGMKLDATRSVAGNGESNCDILWRNDNGAVAEWLVNGNMAVLPDATWSTPAKPTNFG